MGRLKPITLSLQFSCKYCLSHNCAEIFGHVDFPGHFISGVRYLALEAIQVQDLSAFWGKYQFLVMQKILRILTDYLDLLVRKCLLLKINLLALDTLSTIYLQEVAPKPQAPHPTHPPYVRTCQRQWRVDHKVLYSSARHCCPLILASSGWVWWYVTSDLWSGR